MDYNPYTQTPKFVELLNSQQESVFRLVEDSVEPSSSQVLVFATQATEGSNFEQDSPAERKERRTWTPTNDVVLISSWLNTSKDPVVGNEQRSVAFWKRIAAYFSASSKLAGCEKREASHCKQRWHKINDLVCKFCGAYELQPERKAVVKMTMMFSNLPTKSSSTTTKRSSPLSMLGRSCAMTRSGVIFLRLEMMEAPKGGSVRMVHIQQALKQMKPIVL